MDELRLQAVAARVVAWHNRHPLARRISKAQVQALGYVALPYAGSGPAQREPAATATLAEQAAAAPEGGTLRERASARARQGGGGAPNAAVSSPNAPTTPGPVGPPAGPLKAAFDDDFIAPLTPRQVARWASRHGRALAQAPADAPLRKVPLAAGQRGAATATLYVLSAAVEVGTLRARVLIGAGTAAAVLGPRLWSGPRLAAAALGTLMLSLALLGVGWHRGEGVAVEGVAAAASAPAPAASALVAPVALVVATAGVPADAEPQAGPAEAASGPAPGQREPVAHGQEDAGVAPPQTASAPQAPAPAVEVATTTQTAPTFALSTRPLRTRAEAEQVMAAMGALLRTVKAGEVRTEILPEGDDWRVVGWPFTRRDQADQARTLLVGRGMRVEVIGF